MDLKLELLDLELTIAKLASVDDLESLFSKARFFSLTKTDDEVSLVIDTACAPSNQFVSTGWNAFKIIGPLDFSLVGILEKVIHPLSKNNISVFTVSTFDTDYILVKQEQVSTAQKILSSQFKILT